MVLYVNLVLNPNVGDIGDTIEAFVGYDGGIGQDYWVGVDWGDGFSSSQTVWGWTPATLVHQYQDEGTFTVTASVQDLITGEPGNDTEQVTIQAGSIPPPVRIGFSAAPSMGQIPFTTTFTVAIGDGVGPYTVNINYGDGQTDIWTYPTPTTFTVTHTYYVEGTYQASINVTDSRGDSATAETTIIAANWIIYALAAAGIVAVIGIAYVIKKRR